MTDLHATGDGSKCAPLSPTLDSRRPTSSWTSAVTNLLGELKPNIVPLKPSHEAGYLAFLKSNERASVAVYTVWLAVSGVLEFVYGSHFTALRVFGKVFMFALFALRVPFHDFMPLYWLCGINHLGRAMWLVARMWTSTSVETIVTTTWRMQVILVVGAYCFRRHAPLALALSAPMAFAMMGGLSHLPNDAPGALYHQYYITTTLGIVFVLVSLHVQTRNSFANAQANKDLKDTEIGALTQICHVIKNKLNFVEGALLFWGDKIRSVPGLGDRDNDFGQMQYCVEASLAAVGNVNVLRSIKAGSYHSAMVATEIQSWASKYAANHDLATSLSETVPAELVVHMDTLVAGFVLEDAWSNAFKYGDSAKFRPEMGVRLVAGDGQSPMVELCITNRQWPGYRLQNDHRERLFERGAKGVLADTLSDGLGLADALQAAEAAGGTVSLTEKMRRGDGGDGDEWYTTFTLSLPGSVEPSKYVSVENAAPYLAVDIAQQSRHVTPQSPRRGVPSPQSPRRGLDYSVHPAAAPDNGAAAGLPPLPPFPKNLTVVACDDQRVQRRVLEKIFLGKLEASEKSVVLGFDLDEVKSVVPLALSLEADIVILDQNLLHGGTLGTQLADELHAAGFGGLVVLRTGSSTSQMERFQQVASIDLAIDKGAPNLETIEEIKSAFGARGRGRAARGVGY